ncbi:MAG: hypothetical protein WA989_01220 [Henriciella sp.]|uniref:hypothetical protein n=1 Tax=Henriciella sp. TaxID=1968823 RepID=UPI003C747DC4
MAEVGANGTVQRSDEEPSRDYFSTENTKVKRVALACFLCGIAASILVALIALVIAFVYSSVASLTGRSPGETLATDGFMAGAYMAVMIAGFNWFVFYVVVPVTWLVLGLSIGMFPRRGIRRHAPYYRWGAIWGALLVGLTTGVFGGGMNNSLAAFGAFATGAAIGAVAGLICSALFLAIVRPKAQLSSITTDVF